MTGAAAARARVPHVVAGGAFLTAVLALCAPRATAQGFNVDVGVPVNVPSSGYGGGAKQPGIWNAVSGGTPGVVFPLVDVSGTAGPVSVSYVVTGNGIGNHHFDNPQTQGDDEALMDDLLDVGSGSSLTRWTFTGLQPGLHLVFTHAWAPDGGASDISKVRVPNSPDPEQFVGGPWPGQQELGVTYSRHSIQVGAAGTIQVRVIPGGLGFASLNGIQIVDMTGCPTPQTYCTAKPDSLGCPGKISTAGLSSINYGSFFTVRYQPAPAGNVGLFIYTTQGTLATPIQNAFGWQCIASNGLFRTPPTNTNGTPGTCQGSLRLIFKEFFLTQTADPSLVVGATVDMQGWYRDPPNPGGANLTDAVQFQVCP